MTIEEYIEKNLNLTTEGEYIDDNTYKIELDDSEIFSKVFNELDSNSLLIQKEGSSRVDEEESTFTFEDDTYIIKLNGKFNENLYTLILMEKSK